MTVYNPDDFKTNPGKYKLFATARVNAAVDGFDVGQIVAIKHYWNIWNESSKRIEPTYDVTDKSGERRFLFAGALSDFVL